MKKQMIVFKHHIKEHFDADPSLYSKDNGPGKGGTVFLTFASMSKYLQSDDREWCFCQSDVKESDLKMIGNNQATVLCDYGSIDGWHIFQK